MLHKETCADVQPGTGEDVGMVVDGPVGAFQLPAQGLGGIGQRRFGKGAVDQARLFPCQRGGGWSQHFLKQLQRRGVDITRFCTGDDTRLRRDHFTQGAQLLLQQRHGFWQLNQHHARRLRIVSGTVEELDARLGNIVVTQVLTCGKLAEIGVANAVRRMFRQRTAQRTEGIIQDQHRAANLGIVQLLQQIFICSFPRQQRVNVIRFRETFK